MALGTKLRVGKYVYTDLDELIVSHVKAMARKVQELINHDRYHGSMQDTSKYFPLVELDLVFVSHSLTSILAFLETWLDLSLMANPDKPNYALAMDKSAEKGGQFYVSFRTGPNDRVQSWVSQFLVEYEAPADPTCTLSACHHYSWSISIHGSRARRCGCSGESCQQFPGAE